MKNLVSPLEPFYYEWQGNVAKMQIRDFEMSVGADCLPEFVFKCWQLPIDKDEAEMYYKHKRMEEKKMDYRVNLPYKIDWDWQGATTLKTKEKIMELSKAYKFNKKCKEDRRAIDLGALTEDGLLTCEGKDLLLNILLSDPKIREQFDKVLEDIDESKED